MLLNHFIELCAKRSGKPHKRISEKSTEVLEGYDWPGNVRELQNLVERLFTITEGPVIDFEDISVFNMPKRELKKMTLKKAVKDFEQQYIFDVLDSVGGNRKRAAEILGIHRNTLLTKTSGLNRNIKR